MGPQTQCCAVPGHFFLPTPTLTLYAGMCVRRHREVSKSPRNCSGLFRARKGMMLLLDGSVLGKEHARVGYLTRPSLGSPWTRYSIHGETRPSNRILSLPNALCS